MQLPGAAINGARPVYAITLPGRLRVPLAGAWESVLQSAEVIFRSMLKFSQRNRVDQYGAPYVFRPDSHALAVPIADYTKFVPGELNRTLSAPRLQFVAVPSARILKEFALPDRLLTLAFHPQGDLLVCVANSGALELRDSETGEIRGPRSPMNGATSAAFSGDGHRLFVGRRDGTAELWELDALLNTRDK